MNKFLKEFMIADGLKCNSQLIRQSNVELLRIVCMLMILVHHFITHGFYSIGMILGDYGGLDFISCFAITLNSFCYIGVNCFILISGYFGIKFKWKAVYKLYFILMFYEVVHCFIDLYVKQETRSFGELINDIIFVIPSDRWWFMNCYFIFMFLTPLLRLKEFTNSQYKQAIVLLSIANIYFGYLLGFYSNGYSVAHFVFIYVIGGYLKRIDLKKYSRSIFLVIYIVSCLLFAILSVVSHYYSIPHWDAMSYNNPLLVLGAIGFFLFFLSFNLHSKIVNNIANSALSVYLLQDLQLFKVFSNKFGGIGLFDNNIFVFAITLLGGATIFLIVSYFIDQIRLFFYYSVNIIGSKFCYCINK